ncbi:hypothetical protein LIER_32257 [Lithospermum erythrorhizon]|uniref:Uncharacterized protein n=1 Tax=Lithospermum erythrorhizon TaxID=34254 RepID=A0AAV3RWZ4_LITER
MLDDYHNLTLASVSTKSVPSSHPMITRTKTNSLKPKVFQVSKYPLSSELIAPVSYTHAKGIPIWEKAMNDELLALTNNNTWSLVELPAHHHIINCK